MCWHARNSICARCVCAGSQEISRNSLRPHRVCVCRLTRHNLQPYRLCAGSHKSLAYCSLLCSKLLIQACRYFPLSRALILLSLSLSLSVLALYFLALCAPLYEWATLIINAIFIGVDSSFVRSRSQPQFGQNLCHNLHLTTSLLCQQAVLEPD